MTRTRRALIDLHPSRHQGPAGCRALFVAAELQEGLLVSTTSEESCCDVMRGARFLSVNKLSSMLVRLLRGHIVKRAERQPQQREQAR